MKRILKLTCLFSLLMIASCFEPPNYSNTPRIEFENIRTKSVPGSTTADSLIISINFRDGDGDLGHSGTETAPPFNARWYFLLTPGPTCEKTVSPPCLKVSFVDEGNLSNVVKYSTRRTNPNYDTLPLYEKPFLCDNYQIIRDDDLKIIDTLYIQRNPRAYNFFCDLYVKKTTPSGPVFGKYNWEVGVACPPPGGSGLTSRFDILGKDGNPDLGLPAEGTLTFRVATNSFFAALKNETLKLKIRIVDRAGNYSNEVDSKVFTLD